LGLEIRDITVHELNNKKRWFNLPSKSYVKEDKTLGWSYVLDFYDKEMGNKFTKSLDEAYEKFIEVE